MAGVEKRPAPLANLEISACVSEKGIVMLEAPVSGGEPKAIEGTLAIMVGGPERALEEAKPILSAMGSSVSRLGEIGHGNVAKLANQISGFNHGPDLVGSWERSH